MINKDELDDILNDPLFNITDTEKKLFSLSEILILKANKQKTDYVAQKKECQDFYLYAPLFKQVHQELSRGKRSLVRYSEKNLKEGGFYIVSGVLAFLEKIINVHVDKSGHTDGRTRIVYENGTESDIKLRTLGKNIQHDGFVVTESKEYDNWSLDSFKVGDEDIHDGWIYILRSLSEEPEIANQKDLYKIGFSTTSVKERTKNSEYEPTYLMDKVEIVREWKTYNLKTQAFESIIHQFFAAARFNVKVYDLAGNEHKPKEWFVVPLPIIQTVIQRIIDGSIIKYHYNTQLQMLEEVDEQSEQLQSDKIDTAGWHILSLIIKEKYFKEILSGEKTIEYRELKQNKLSSYTWVEQESGIRYLKKYDAIRFYVGYHKDRDLALVEITDTTYDEDNQMIKYHLGKVLEVSIKER
ncbi:GIY-YIG nuclease family protein [Massilibacteroides sp.]|uniref:GIY-YIG nuclease family protein n=1 Tax=Massilibacteroides sp. TaxID=2034766 RepID=UPI00262FCD55|nr:GIY-YIG nuclease family protein [Massilibacteroides sp.]MDD4514830.1 GIY-YIG nuclease family protein [Massilibacteroides sp.]